VPDLEDAPRRITARAAELMASRLGAALADRIPAELAGATRRRVAEAQELAEAVAGLEPALGALGLDRDLSADAYEAIAAVCRTLARFPEAGRVRLAAHARVDEAIVSQAKARLDDLVAAEADWRGLFPGFGLHAAPRAAEIRRAAHWLRKGGLSRVFSGLGEEATAARAVVRKLGISAAADPRHLDQLADYLAFAEGFAAEPAYLRAFGPVWAGIATPFAEMAAAANLRHAFVAGLKSFSHGEAVGEATLRSGAAGIHQLADLAPAAERFLIVDDSVRLRLADMTLGQVAPLMQAEMRAGAAILDMAEDAELVRYSLPLSIIADVHRARDGLAAAQAEAERSPDVGAIADILDGRPAQAALSALAYLRHLADSELPVAAKINLAGRRAGDLRALLARLAEVIGEALPRLKQAGDAAEVEFGAFNLGSGDNEADGLNGLSGAVPSEALARIDALIAQHGQLADFLALRRLKLDLAQWGLGAFIDAAERQGIAPDRLDAIFDTLVAERRADLARRARPALTMGGMALEARRQIFAERDRAKILADRAKLRARLVEARPPAGNNLGPKSGWTETALLRHEFAKSARHLALRPLMSRAGRAIQALTPCFMMSPLSLAKFIAPSGPRFDLVVIDEASQMRPEDALGGLLRSGQVVVVGDPKQLPPTDFFARMAMEGEEEDDEDLSAESILEICTRSFSTRRRLKWHYRSRCESLIAFSNREFYDGKLVTFPNARPDAFSIDLIRVDGAYKASRNVAEAARVAEEAVAFMRYAAELDDGALPSLGIVAVNRDQRDLIAEELRRLMHADELADRYRTRVAARGEPLFVKNLENVQGDERDYIFVSLTYGPAEGTRAVAQRFGPIAGKHGHRRLNVLFTRARQRIGLFASFGSADVHPIETSAQGVHVLKRYLAYVEERGRRAADSIGGEPDSDFEREVAARLTEAGFRVECQVGVAGYRIDLGVRHPDRPDSFLAGVECDGARYHSSRSARDRDRLREEVLKGLGWQIVRVWSTDWFADPDEETRRLVRRLDLLRVLPDRVGSEYRLKPDLPRPDAAGSVIDDARKHPEETVLERQLSLFDEADAPVPGDGAVAGVGVTEAIAVGAGGETEAGDAAAGGEAGEETGELDAPHAAVEAAGQADGEAATQPDGAEAAAGGFAEPVAGYAAEIPDDGPLDQRQLEAALVAFRETRIRRGVADWERQRSILRDAMIETFVAQRLDDPADWFAKVPAYQRQATNAAEKRFLADICAIVARGM
ncbi:MAG: AAA domain-containing protein, partial [Ancalomicrobiaceae bacterium]|nr:AAA domain-containing protein [Ancalomicrobiaceae bacterium]